MILRQQDEKKSIKKFTLIELAPEPHQRAFDEHNSLRNRIVETALSEKIITPELKSFLGRQNQRVDREVVARQRSVQIEAGGGLKSKNSARKVPQLSELGMKFFSNRDRQVGAEDRADWATPGMRPQDYVEGMKESEMTALNTKEFIFYGYFHRIRERLDQAWVPILRKKLVDFYKSGRHLASDIDHITKIVVVLNNLGEITHVQIISNSGLIDLDEAAVSAFNQAGPFPNPPKEMIDINKEIKIPWDFVLKT